MANMSDNAVRHFLDMLNNVIKYMQVNGPIHTTYKIGQHSGRHRAHDDQQSSKQRMTVYILRAHDDQQSSKQRMTVYILRAHDDQQSSKQE